MLKTRFDWVADGYNTHTVYLRDGERVIGYKSNRFPVGAYHYDF